MKKNHQVQLNDKQVEFLVKCIDISQELQSMKPEKSEIELIRRLTHIQQKIEDEKLDYEDNIMTFDLGY
tara:strand:- start:1394 stop:1600 length:207 start_codon:yes stop_codon:yes gene_type:complete